MKLYILLSLNITIMTVFFIFIKYYIDDKIIKLKYCLSNKKNKKRTQHKRPRPISTGKTQPEKTVKL